MSAFSWGAPRLIKMGYSPVPLDPRTGIPAGKRWNVLAKRQMTPDSVRQWSLASADYRLGVVGGFNYLVPIDVDTDDAEVLAAFCSVMPKPVVVRRGTKGFVAFYRSLEPLAGCKLLCPAPNPKPLVEVLTTGNVTIPPSKHRVTGKEYRWVSDRTLFNTRIDELTVVTPSHIAMLRKALEPWCPARPEYVPPAIPARSNPGPHSDKRMRAFAERCLDNEVGRLAATGSGRNWALYQTACRLGKFVHHGIISHGQFSAALFGASKTNGYVAKKGSVQCRQTIQSGFLKSASDKLPILADRPAVPRMSSQQEARA